MDKKKSYRGTGNKRGKQGYNVSEMGQSINSRQTWTNSNYCNNKETQPTSPDSNLVDYPLFYGVFIPQDSESLQRHKVTVFTEKSEALRIIKQNRRARFKSFFTEKEAITFSKFGGEVLSTDSPPVNNDRTLFKGPKSQELVVFRKAIEVNDLSHVIKAVEENPRYLVGSGDTPTILQEGSRYNALHIAARAFSSEICSYILNVISDTDFIKKLYGPNSTNLVERRDMLVDLYLNMPDKGSNETPLHFASKLGALEVVKVLVRYPQCDRLRRNKCGQTASEIICSRASAPMMGNAQEIAHALEAQYFIPVLRTADNSVPPVIGDPFTHLCPPKVANGLITPPLEVRAVAGPMSEEQARVFRKKWKTPPRNSDSPYLQSRPELSDPDKGLEKVGRDLANEFRVPWTEYWPFLHSFQNLSTQEGLSSLEEYLKGRFNQSYEEESSHELEGAVGGEGFNIERTPEHTNDSMQSNLMIENLTRDLSKLSLLSPDTNDDSRNEKCQPTIPSDSIEYLNKNGDDCLDVALRNESPMFFDGYQHALNKIATVRGTVSLATMETSCQVFASRIGYNILKGTKDSVFAEIAKFQVFIAGCVTDKRFRDIKIGKCHYRLAALVCNKIMTTTDDRNGVTAKVYELLRSEPTRFEEQKLPLDTLIQAATCVCRYTAAILSCYSRPESDCIDLLWSVAEECSCSIPVLRNARSKYIPRMLFYDENGPEGGRTTSSDDDGEELSDDDYFTAPNSPEFNFSVDLHTELSSDEDEEIGMLPSESGPEVFLTGNKPTKLDKLVLEALEHVSLPLKDYPHILMWKYSCQEYAKEEPSERWLTPRPRKASR